MSPILGSLADTGANTFGLMASSPKPIVTGGTLSSDSTYYYRTFTGNGTLAVSVLPLACDYLVIAGGGGGGSAGGGAGAGGVRSSSATLSVGSYNAVVGAGGAGYFSDTSGNSSSFNSLNTTGGGRGGNFINPTP
jgi:hypothetical protein